MVLSNGERLEGGTCSINWVKELCKINKDKLISSCRVHKNTVNPDNLSKQKVKPALALFSTELTKALECEFGEKAKGTYSFLNFINKHVIQLLITTDPNKYHLVPESKPFFSSTDERLDHMIEISLWMQNSCHPSVHVKM